MATVTHPLQHPPKSESERVDRWLYIAESEWAELPDIEAEFDTWDALETLNFIVEWPLAEMRLDDLSRYAAEGKMSASQHRAYEELLKLVERHRPIVVRLLST